MWSVALELPEHDDETLTDEEREEYGISTLAPRPIATIDPLPGFVPVQRNGRLLPVERAAVVETSKGVEIYRHPTMLEIEHPHLAAYVAELRAIGPQPLTRDDYRRRSARYVEAWRVMVNASARLHAKRPDTESEEDAA